MLPSPAVLMKPLPPIIFEQSSLSEATPGMMDYFWGKGWRHFGTDFFRYSISFDDDGQKIIQPLRLNLEKFQFSKSQRRVLRRNEDLTVKWVRASLHEEVCTLFQRHKGRFETNVPEHLSNFLGEQPGQLITCHECQVWEDTELVAASFMEASTQAGSGVYGVFEPTITDRSLGLFTMLTEIRWCLEHGMKYYYSGYATHEPSHYDYKKRLAGLEIYDWETEAWLPTPRVI
jgi:leucyl-tRNA---protein transferase